MWYNMGYYTKWIWHNIANQHILKLILTAIMIRAAAAGAGQEGQGRAGQ